MTGRIGALLGARGPLLMAAFVVVVAGAKAQDPTALHWTRIAQDSTSTEWMDTSHVVRRPDGQVQAWYRVHAAHEPQLTVVQYLIDCVGFRLSVRRALTYDTLGTVTTDESVPSPPFPPPPIPALQDFMHRACEGKAASDSAKR